MVVKAVMAPALILAVESHRRRVVRCNHRQRRHRMLRDAFESEDIADTALCIELHSANTVPGPTSLSKHASGHRNQRPCPIHGVNSITPVGERLAAVVKPIHDYHRSRGLSQDVRSDHVDV